MLPKGKIPLKKVGLGLLAFLLTAVMLFGGYFIVQRARYGSIDSKHWREQGVVDFRTRLEGNELILEIEAEKLTNFRLTMEDLINQVEKGKGQRVVRVDFLKPDGSALETAYNKLSFTLAEAQATGKYTLLPTAAELIEAEEKVRVGIEVGERFIFVQLNQGKDRLYRAVRLQADRVPALVMTGGG